MINFEEELKKFHPSLEVEDAEEAIYNEDLTDAWYYLGQSYRLTDQKEKAIECYEKFIQMAPNTERAERSQRHIDTLSAN